MNCDEVLEHIQHCTSCRNAWYQILGGMLSDRAAKAGSTRSEAKSAAARLNGLKGGRPKKKLEDGQAK